MRKKKTTDEFIADAIIVHGDLYDYSTTTYTSRDQYVIVVCLQHGEFSQLAGNHLSGGICPTCASIRRHIGRDEMINRFIEAHGDRYDYSRVVSNGVNGVKTIVTIVCPEHGEFQQQARYHMNGHGCTKCGGTTRIGTADFVNRATAVHGDRYGYDSVDYRNNKTDVTIVCPEHGEFQQYPQNHLRGQGCPNCGIEKRSIAQTSNRDEWASKAILVHGDRYNYDTVVYTEATDKVRILCTKCGVLFLQRPSDHLTGYGCPRCVHRISKPSQQWLDSLGIPDDPEHREVAELIPGSRYEVDGYDPETKTVYEFLGDYWHGNPEIHPSDGINPTNKRSYGDLYDTTIRRMEAFVNAGYRYVSIWQSEWKKLT